MKYFLLIVSLNGAGNFTMIGCHLLLTKSAKSIFAIALLSAKVSLGYQVVSSTSTILITSLFAIVLLGQ
jgi:hypothetical protein